jgi:hypothetical protein
VQKSTGNSLALSWDRASDNRLVRNYIVRVDGAVHSAPSVPAVYIADLEPNETYSIQISAVDFNQNISAPLVFDASTLGYPSVNERIEAEAYVSQSGVQFQTPTDVGGGDNAGWINVGDYLEYIVDVPTTGNYRFDARVAGESRSGQLALLANSQLKTTLDIPITGGWQTWQSVSSNTFQLQAGLNTIRLRVERDGFNLNYFQITSV